MIQGLRPSERSRAYKHAQYGWTINQAVEVPLVVYTVNTGMHATSRGTVRITSGGPTRTTWPSLRRGTGSDEDGD
jgi:hypothetical protein